MTSWSLNWSLCKLTNYRVFMCVWSFNNFYRNLEHSGITKFPNIGLATRLKELWVTYLLIELFIILVLLLLSSSYSNSDLQSCIFVSHTEVVWQVTYLTGHAPAPGQHTPGFLKFRKSVCMWVHVCIYTQSYQKLVKWCTMIWTPYDWLNTFCNLYICDWAQENRSYLHKIHQFVLRHQSPVL